GCAQRDDRARVRKREGLRDEIVLAAHAARYLAVLERIRDDGAEQRRHHGVVDEARFNPRAALLRLIAVQLVDEGARAHAQLGEYACGTLAQRGIEAARAKEKSRVQQRAVDLTLEHAGTHEVEKALDEHLAHAVKTGRERRALAQLRGHAIAGIEPRRELTEFRVVPVPQDERLRHRVTEQADAQLQRAAVGDDARHVEPDRVFGKIDGLARRREQGKVGCRALQEEVEFVRSNIAVAGHEGQLRIDLAHEDEIALAARAAAQEIEREVRIAAQTQARLA